MNRRRVGVLLLAIGAVSVPCDTAAQCVTQLHATSSASYIGVSAGTNMTNSQINSAIGMWETCSEYGDYFPQFTASAVEINIGVDLLGANPDVDGGCGNFFGYMDANARLTGGYIELYSHNGAGADCSSTRTETLAHELGHALGLGNSSCPGYIMYGNTGIVNSRSVQSAECDFADGQWTTAWEEGTDDGGGGTDDPATNCPLILDLNGDGIKTTSLLNPVRFFDPDGDRLGNEGGWTAAGGEDGFVWLDVDGDEQVRPGELVGSGMVLTDGVVARNGFQVLQFYDRLENGGNADGQISRSDEIFHKLRLWVDRNHDGMSIRPQAAKRDEVTSLSAHRIVAIRTSFRHVHTPDGHGNVRMLTGTYTRVEDNALIERAADDYGFRVRSN